MQSSYKGEAMSYHLLREEGPEHDKTFVVQLFIGDKGFEEGRGRTKKSAEQEAAYRTMMILKGQQ